MFSKQDSVRFLVQATGSLEVAFVDIKRAVAGCAEGRKARVALKEIFDQHQQDLDREQAAVKTATGDLNRERASLPAEVVRQRENELRARVDIVQAAYKSYQKDLSSREEAALRPIENRIRGISGRMGSARGLVIVFDTPSAGVDLTDEAIRRLDAGE